jgi:hypothetical protein
MHTSSSRSRAVLGAALALVLLVPAVLPAAAQSAQPAPTLEDLGADGGALVERFLEILSLQDEEKVTELEGFLGEEFQLLRASGARLDKDAYLAAPSSVDEYAISDVVATQHDDLVVVSYLLAVTATIGGAAHTSTAPRMSVFHWNGQMWQLAAHSNFAAISETPEPTASPAP